MSAHSPSPLPRPRLSPLIPPEILQLIFSFLSEHQLSYSVTRVSKLWRTVGLTRISITARWEESMMESHQFERFANEFDRARILYCTFGHSMRLSKVVKARSRKLLETCLASLVSTPMTFATTTAVVPIEMTPTTMIHGGKENESLLLPPPPPRRRPLLGQEIKGSVRVLESGSNKQGLEQRRFSSLVLDRVQDLKIFGFQFFGALSPFITNVEIQRWEAEVFPFDTVLDQFPMLEHLSVTYPIKQYSRNVCRLVLDGPKFLMGADEQGSDRVPMLGLKSLRLNGLSCDLSLLYGFLRSCPELQILRLVNFYGIIPNERAYYGQLSEDQIVSAQELLQHIKGSCPRIRSLHLSGSTPWFPSEILERMTKVWPPRQLQTFEMPANSIYPAWGYAVAPFTRVIPKMNFLTTLELTDQPTLMHPLDQKATQALHKFLCDAPFLLHLRAKSVPFQIGRIYQDGTHNPPTRLWACRDLQTLEIELVTFMYESDPALIKQAQADSRAWFAYLAKVCRKLNSIWFEKSELRLDLEGGLCLLSELQDLEKLVIVSKSQAELEWRDIEWLSSRKERVFSSDDLVDVDEANQAGWVRAWTAMKEWIGSSLWKAPMSSSATIQDKAATAAEERDRVRAEKRRKAALSPGILEQIEWLRTEDGVAEVLERLTMMPAMGGECENREGGATMTTTRRRRCWPDLDVLRLLPTVSLYKQKRGVEMVECLRPELKRQEVPAVFVERPGYIEK